MPERPKQNWEGRDIISFGPKFRIDLNNPQMGGDGTNVYTLYGVTNNGDVALTGLSEGGNYRILNDKSIELIAGSKGTEGGVDIVISGMSGDITITAMKNGAVRIKASNVMIQADEDIDFKAGRNLNLSAGSGRIFLKGNQADVDAELGNLAEATTGNFAQKILEGQKVIEGVKYFTGLGLDVLQSAVGGFSVAPVGITPSFVANTAGKLFK